MAGENRGGPPTQVLIACAALVIVIAGIQAASNVVTPVLVAIFLAVILAVPVAWLERCRVPRGIAVLLVTLAMLGIVIGLGAFLGAAVGGLLNALPNYQVRLNQQFTQFLSWLRGYGVDITMEAIRAGADPGRIMQLIGGLLAGLGGLVSNGVLILLVVVFILLEADSLLRKIRAAFGQDSRGLQQINRFFDSFKVYVAIKTLISLTTGLLVWGFLSALAIEYATVWGLLAFLLNYIPNIGSIIAAVPAVLMALGQFGPLRALAVILGYLVVNGVLGAVVEPRLMGRGVGLSTLVVFLSLILWAWVLGPVGMVLAVPLMVGLKLALEVSDSTRWLAVLLGPATDTGAPIPGEVDPGAQG
jgi:AI-2 transport protein TqsA